MTQIGRPVIGGKRSGIEVDNIGSVRGVGQAQFAPDAIPGLALWLKADAITGTTNGAAVSTWHDSSTNARDFTNSTAAEQPLYATTIANGLPAVQFSSVTSNHLVRSSGFLAGQTGAMFAVIRSSVASDAGANHQVLGSATTATGTTQRLDLGVIPQNTSVYGIFENSSAGGTTGLDFVRGAAAITSGVFSVVHQRSVGTSYVQQINGADDALTTGAGVNSGDWYGDQSNLHNVVLGARSTASGAYSNLWNGYIAEVIVYDAVTLTTAQVRQVTAYLGSKYAITV